MIYGWTGTPGAGKTREMLHQVFVECGRLVASHRKYALHLLSTLFFLRRLVRNSEWCTQLAISFPFLRGAYRRLFRVVWRSMMVKRVKKEKLVPVLFINFYTPEGKPAINLEFWQKHFPEIHFILYPYYPARESRRLLNDLIGEWNVPDKTPVFSSLWVFDELQQFFPKTATNAKPTIYEQFFEKHRHFGVNVYFTTQGMKLLSSHFRELIEKHFHISNPFRNGFVQIMEFTGCNMRLNAKEAARVSRGFQKTYIFQAYTSSMMHIEKKGVPLRIKLAVLFVLLLIFLVFYRWYSSRQAIKEETTKKLSPSTPQLNQQPNQIPPSGNNQIQPIEAAKPAPVPVSISSNKFGGDKITGWKQSENENPFRDYGVSDPTHVSFHGVVKVSGVFHYRMCFYLTNQYCTWVEHSTDSLKVKKVLGNSYLMVWKDWVIPQTKEGIHPQLSKAKFDQDTWGAQLTGQMVSNTPMSSPMSENQVKK